MSGNPDIDIPDNTKFVGSHECIPTLQTRKNTACKGTSHEKKAGNSLFWLQDESDELNLITQKQPGPPLVDHDEVLFNALNLSPVRCCPCDQVDLPAWPELLLGRLIELQPKTTRRRNRRSTRTPDQMMASMITLFVWNHPPYFTLLDSQSP